jgi:hypothetical protein
MGRKTEKGTNQQDDNRGRSVNPGVMLRFEHQNNAVDRVPKALYSACE